jgi:hypothetical protein
MKVRTFIIMVGAMLALSASAAQAGLERILPAAHGIAPHHKVVAKKTATSQVVPNQIAPTVPGYIYVPAPGAGSASDTSATPVDSSASNSSSDNSSDNC